MATVERLMTAEEFGRLPDDGRRYELVRGVLVEMNMPKPRHGQICGRIQVMVGSYCEQRKLGHVLCNDSGILVQRGPDTVRGADVCFYPFAKLPPGPLGTEYLALPPDVVFEVLSPDDRPVKVMRKMREYLAAGVLAVVIVDPDDRDVEIHRPGRDVEIVTYEDQLRVPEIDPDFAISVQSLLG
jgi:Uma2 family endonuclease